MTVLNVRRNILLLTTLLLAQPVFAAQVGDWVWDDTNEIGIQDVGEIGLAGVVVNLQNCSGNVLASTTTSSAGFY